MKRWMMVLVPALVGYLAPAQTKAGDHWVATWATAELLLRTPPPAQPPAAAPKGAAAGFNNQTVRMAVRVSMGGQRLRIRVSNAFGSGPVTLGAAHIALRGTESEIVAGSDHAITFAGKPGCVLRSGMVLASDPVDMTVPALADLSVSLYFPEPTGPPTSHGTALHHTFVKEGDLTSAPSLADGQRNSTYYYLAGLDVMAAADAGAVVTLGDSITDGARSTDETNHSWPALLAARLAGNKATANVGVANVGIGGNRVLRDGSGANAIARFDRDVLSQPGVKWVMLLEGINDIGHNPTDPVTADELIAGQKQIIGMAHDHGLKAIGCTLTPYGSAGYSNAEGEAMRAALNQWIRTSGAYDAVVDFEAATRDAAHPTQIRAEFDPGDHLHPNNAGYEAMANAIDLSIFGRAAKPSKKPKK